MIDDETRAQGDGANEQIARPAGALLDAPAGQQVDGQRQLRQRGQ